MLIKCEIFEMPVQITFMVKSTLAEIEAEFLNEEGWKKTSWLDREQVRSWMDSDDLEVLGAIHALLFVKENLGRVVPPLSFEEILRFRKHYYTRCLREYKGLLDEPEESQWVWAVKGLDATHGAIYWFIEVWKDKTVERSVLVELKNWLEQLLKERVQEGMLVTAVYDHLLSQKSIAKFLADWQDDPELRSVLNL